MILYVDTSALMKLFVVENQSEVVLRSATAATHVFVSQLAWVEMCAGLSLKVRTSQIDEEVSVKALDELRKEWPRFAKLAVNAELIDIAGQLAPRFGLRAYDSVQLASAQRVHQQAGDAMLFCCFDRALNAAAVGLGMPILGVAASAS